MLAQEVRLEDAGCVVVSSDIMVLSASTFFVAVSAGLEAVRPAMGAINDGRSWALAAVPSPISMIEVIAA